MAEDADGFLDDFNKKIKTVIDSIGDAFKSNLDPSRIVNVMDELDQQASEVIKTFGQGRENIVGIKQAMADAVVEVRALGGEFEDIVRIQNDIASTLGRNLVLASDSYKELYAAGEASQVPAQTIAESFKDIGVSVYNSSKNVENILNTARSIGVSGKAVTQQVTDNIGLLNRYTFQGGVDGLAKMAAQAVNLRINVREIEGAMKKAFNPESAIEMAASLQRLGVTQSDLLDPLRLMDLSQNDPAELQNQIAEMTKQFVTLNEKGQFEIMPGAKRQLMEIAGAMDMDYNTITKMALGSAELGDKMSKISFPDTFTEEQKTMIANMAEIGEGGQYKMTIDGESLGIADAMERLKGDDQAMKDLMDAAKPKTLEELTKDQLGYMKSMQADLNSIKDKIPYAIASMRGVSAGQTKLAKGSQAIAGSLNTESLSIKNIRGQFESLYDGISGSISQNGIDFENLSKTVTNFGTYIDTSLMESFKELDKRVNEAVNFKISDILKGMDKSLGVSSSPEQQAKVGNVQGNVNTANVNTLNTITTESKNTNTNVSETNSNQNITLKVIVESGDIPQDQVLAVLNKTDTIQTINNNLNKVNSNNGLTKT